MCGIAGYYSWSGKPVGNSSTVLKMLEAQRHRGPDDSGIRGFSLRAQVTKECSKSVPESLGPEFEGIIGFNRLSILDLSINGHQPMCSSDEKVVLAFNGEVYNAFDFKAELEAGGYRFKSTSDTEVILALYLKYGFDGMITRLNGMFALVLADVAKQVLYIARDRFGIKPMYLFEYKGCVAFASELKSFFELPDFVPALNESLVDEFLMFRSNLNGSLFRGIEVLEPGTYKIISPVGQENRRFFSINSYSRSNVRQSWSDTLVSLESSLKKGVHRQLISDVKLGCQLSGGIDSSLVTYYAKNLKRDDLLKTISIVFGNSAFNEEPYIDQVFGKLGVKAHKFMLVPEYYRSNLESATWHFEAPLNHPNTIGIYYLSASARKYVTVLLSGEGADEVFGGYDRFASLMHPFQWDTYLSNLKKNRAAPLGHMVAYLSADYRAVMASSFMTTSMAQSLKMDFSPVQATNSRLSIYNSLTGDLFDRQVKYELLTYLPDLLLRQDKMSMAHSIENRVPYLDNDVVAQSFQIPVQQLIGITPYGEQTKLPLKGLAEGVFGESFSYREKAGFGIPIRDFFSDNGFEEYLMDDLLPSVASRGLFNVKRIQAWVNDLKSISSQDLDALWIMVAFETWAKRFRI